MVSFLENKPKGDIVIETIEKPLSIEEAAQFLGFKKSYIYNLVYFKKIPCYRPGGKRLFFKREDLERFAYRNRQAADFELAERADQILVGNK
jgi:excisionase family DNA binding protein